MRKVNVYIPEQDDAKIREVAERTGIKYAEHVRRAISMYLDSLENRTMYVIQEVKDGVTYFSS